MKEKRDPSYLLPYTFFAGKFRDQVARFGLNYEGSELSAKTFPNGSHHLGPAQGSRLRGLHSKGVIRIGHRCKSGDPARFSKSELSGELARRSTRKGVVRGAASGRNGEAFSMPAGEGSEADRSEGRSKWQKEKERGGEGPGAGSGSDRPG